MNVLKLTTSREREREKENRFSKTFNLNEQLRGAKQRRRKKIDGRCRKTVKREMENVRAKWRQETWLSLQKVKGAQS